MPTPHDETQPTPIDISASSTTHATCPPEDRFPQTPSEQSRSLVVDPIAQMPTPEEDSDPDPTMSETPAKPIDIVQDSLEKQARLPTPSSPVNDDLKDTTPRVNPSASAQPSPTNSSYPLSRKRVRTTEICSDIQPLTLCPIS